MSCRHEFCLIEKNGYHKGFYNDKDISGSLRNIEFSEFFELPDDDEFPYYFADSLFEGSCNHFALSLQKLLNYNAYVIEGKENSKSFHVFCQIYRNKTWYYVDARGVTTVFEEFLNGICSLTTVTKRIIN